MNAEREQLFAGGFREDPLASSNDQREKLLHTTDRLEKSNRTLKQAMATAEESVQIGIGAMDKLNEQTNTMKRVKGNLGDVNEQLGHAKRIMRTMARRVVTNKLIMAAIILVLLGALGLIVYLKWFSGGSSDNNNTNPPPNPTS